MKRSTKDRLASGATVVGVLSALGYIGCFAWMGSELAAWLNPPEPVRWAIVATVACWLLTQVCRGIVNGLRDDK